MRLMRASCSYHAHKVNGTYVNSGHELYWIVNYYHHQSSIYHQISSNISSILTSKYHPYSSIINSFLIFIRYHHHISWIINPLFLGSTIFSQPRRRGQAAHGPWMQSTQGRSSRGYRRWCRSYLGAAAALMLWRCSKPGLKRWQRGGWD